MPRILFASCGSAGHIAPCVAVWRSVQKAKPDATALFVCSTRKEDGEFLEKEGLKFSAFSERSIPAWKILFLIPRAWSLLKHEKPSVIFTKGGGVTLPIALAGWMKGVPVVVHESDSVPGRATKLISRFAKISIDGFRTGNPLRPGITDGSRKRGLEITGLSGSRPVLLVTGGSQGAQIFNDVIARHIDELLGSVDIIHITGKGKSGVEGQKSGYWKTEFVHEDLAHIYAAADMALSRAGSGNIGELAANGIPAILVPIKGLAQDHQVKNAEAAEASGGCVVLDQQTLDQILVSTVRRLAEDPALRLAMKDKIRSLNKPQSAQNVTKILLAVCAEGGGMS